MGGKWLNGAVSRWDAADAYDVYKKATFANDLGGAPDVTPIGCPKSRQMCRTSPVPDVHYLSLSLGFSRTIGR